MTILASSVRKGHNDYFFEIPDAVEKSRPEENAHPIDRERGRYP
jgi:hypothetical protein